MIEERFSNKTIFITGVCGSIGAELLKQISLSKPKKIIGIDNNESALFFLKNEYTNYDNVVLLHCDILNKNRLEKLLINVDYVLHTAAKKHVIISEENPIETVNTNIIGLQNLIDSSIRNKVKRFIFTSSDKAVGPTNVMGATKLIGERQIIEASENNCDTIFAITRFGNVLGSNGSVIPIFKKQIEANLDLTLTHKDMSRFIMTNRQAVDLVIESLFLAKGGEVFVTKMNVLKIADLAKAMIELSNKNLSIVSIGTKKGEKLYEELSSIEEANKTLEIENFFVIVNTPHENSKYSENQKTTNKVYVSNNEQEMTISEIKDFLVNNQLL